LSEDVGKRYEAYGWHVQNLHEDIGLDQLEAALTAADEVPDRPSLIIVRTHIAPGSPNKQDTHGAHGSPLGEEEIKLTKEVYAYPSLEPFFVPDDARRALPRLRRARRAQQAGGSRRSAYRAEFGAEGGRAGALPRGRAARRLRRRRADQKGPDAA
jgi:transketolase